MSEAAKTYTLLGVDGRPYRSAVKGLWGGHRRSRIYGRLDCLAALRAVARGGYAKHRVFFADEATAIAAGFRPCGACCHDRFQQWKSARRTENDEQPLADDIGE
ncbi:metal-binding protein [Nonomuraea sp. MG754425]|uniref:Ada metal-binding domain-containing protein n=1 Tax=Nonomuraea sp. MG754425 TaxID=2570319 RepID=UPI001F353C82|nr:Ada metal-binding domain-containing protein [Nonomuraea sp. MG754425]MCF6472840.1 metal-binding protein [Nonomuraea sp. MG754425]